MLKNRIDIEEATFIRDWLFMKAPEGLAAWYHLESDDVVKYFMENDNSILKAGLRARDYLITNLR